MAAVGRTPVVDRPAFSRLIVEYERRSGLRFAPLEGARPLPRSRGDPLDGLLQIGYLIGQREHRDVARVGPRAPRRGARRTAEQEKVHALLAGARQKDVGLRFV